MPAQTHPRRLRLSVSPSRLAPHASRLRPGLTLIEMLIATAITLLMMAAVVNLFANLSGSIRNRRAVIELSGQLRQVRQRLALDLAGATCPATTWQEPGKDPGYIEIIEGQANDLGPSSLLDDDVNGVNGELDYAVSIIPRNNLVHDDNNDGEIDDAEMQAHLSDGDSLSPGGLGDYDDILALTVQSEAEPFVAQHQGQTVKSNLAEVVWFAVENPANGALGEPGLRSIYRRALLIAPEQDAIDGPPDPQWYYQRYDVSAHYDPTRNAWVPNTLGDLTKRENRFYRVGIGTTWPYPHALASGGAGYRNNPRVQVGRTQLDQVNGQDADATAIVVDGAITSYFVDEQNGGQYGDLPSIVITDTGATQPATARPVMAPIPNAPDAWRLAQITFGPAPLAMHRNGTPGNSILIDRTGDDLMLTDALAFDVRVYDPGAPVFEPGAPGDPKRVSADVSAVAVQPGDSGWEVRYKRDSSTMAPSSYGAYVDLGWTPLDPQDYFDVSLQPVSEAPLTPRPLFNFPHTAGWHPSLDLPANTASYPFGYPAVYDTWSVHYESDGINQDGDLVDSDHNGTPDVPNVQLVDEGKNELDDDGVDGVDNVLELETSPPYQTPLRGLQVRLRLYERSARQIRETSVTQSLAP